MRIDRAMSVIASARRRPAMYFGDVADGSALRQIFAELLSNAIDVFMRGEATRVDVVVDRAGRLIVSDDGPGISVERDDQGTSFLERVITRPHTGPTADGHAPHVHLGSHGVGLAPVCAVSEALEVVVSAPAGAYQQQFARGVATSALTPATAGGQGTRVSLTPDPVIFGTARWDTQWMDDRLRELASLCPGLTLSLHDEGGERRGQVYGPEGSIAALVQLGGSKPLHSGVFSCSADDGYLSARAALRWCDSASARVAGYCNLRGTAEGGTHVRAFERVLVKSLRRALDLPASGAWREPYEALSRGLCATVSVTLIDPHYHGPTKDLLVSREAGRLVARALERDLPGALRSEPELLSRLAARLQPKTAR